MRIAKLQIALNLLLFLVSLAIWKNITFFAWHFSIPIVLYLLSAAFFLLITTVANCLVEEKKGEGGKTLVLSLILGILNTIYWRFLYIVTLAW